MQNIFRRYYRNLIIILLPLFLIVAFVMKSPFSLWLNIVICISSAFVVAFLIGSVNYLQDTSWGPAKREKRMQRSPFTELFANGFTRQGDMVVGTINDYVTVITYTWVGDKSAIKLDVLFHPGPDKHLPITDMLDAIIKRNKPTDKWFGYPYEWTRNSVGSTFEYAFNPPSYEKLIKQAEELTTILIREGLGKISLKEAFGMLDNYLP